MNIYLRIFNFKLGVLFTYDNWAFEYFIITFLDFGAVRGVSKHNSVNQQSTAIKPGSYLTM